MTVAPSSLTPSLFCAEHLAATGLTGFVCQPKSLGVLALAREEEIERKKMEVIVSRPNGEKCSIVLCLGSPEVLKVSVFSKFLQLNSYKGFVSADPYFQQRWP
ncbi:hypothetical protein F0562_011724 [Nyssa sinensis]|uniref:Uncharacterized protein n=1 Tax=Nyssa sinensis TaxID=561372 RepID=A0A5J4ZQF6_9ASTE|nr:hypothetical protein F0562_011724 [Nyssa sinensis]